MAVEAVLPLFRAAVDVAEAALLKMHAQDWGIQEVPAVAAPSPYMVELMRHIMHCRRASIHSMLLPKACSRLCYHSQVQDALLSVVTEGHTPVHPVSGIRPACAQPQAQQAREAWALSCCRVEYLSKFTPLPASSSGSFAGALLERLAGRVIVFFVRHAALLRPLSQAGKIQLAKVPLADWLFTPCHVPPVLPRTIFLLSVAWLPGKQ